MLMNGHSCHLIHQGKRVLRKIQQRILQQKVVLRARQKRTRQENSDSLKTFLNAKKRACIEARSSEEEDV